MPLNELLYFLDLSIFSYIDIYNLENLHLLTNPSSLLLAHFQASFCFKSSLAHLLRKKNLRVIPSLWLFDAATATWASQKERGLLIVQGSFLRSLKEISDIILQRIEKLEEGNDERFLKALGAFLILGFGHPPTYHYPR